jgi:CheY-like chemotaxis protein
MLVEQAATGREAIARLAVVQPDVLLVDLGLPDIHGNDVIRHAPASSARPTPTRPASTTGWGMSSILVKPVAIIY